MSLKECLEKFTNLNLVEEKIELPPVGQLDKHTPPTQAELKQLERRFKQCLIKQQGK